MTSRRSFMLAMVTAICSAPFVAPPSIAAQQLPARTNNSDGVRVVVTPKATAAGSEWEFEVVMDTHTKPLDTDLSRAAVLIDDRGRRYQPLAWRGDAPGGHHRKGTLRFPMPTEQIKAFKIQIESVGGATTRVFEWTIN